ncbi:uncharacterized protein LOC112350316 [Selaginella moellendorffii]|uniref:uncharacterized protein LOC112350316 n=1 Tax=Selaginella moellendorffii TaxID=88036 RepID=UPI000D1CD6B7|nr:uncharacterized protein LOC112350316 [Selaginella moellendorffii]|eukprot:XP_024542054.1 uncharacterized protein LOC112350316 [Selaginella moellendorffii]
MWFATSRFRSEVETASCKSLQRRLTTFTTFASSGISREQALFVTLEGLAGVGKTRFLLETKERVGEALKGRASALQELHRVGATAAVYITFSGSAVGHSSPHLLHPAFVAICKERGGYRSGRDASRSCENHQNKSIIV